ASCQSTTHIVRSGRSTTNCYVQFGFDNSLRRKDITCTPTQEFYCSSKHQWLPAYQLKVGDTVLCVNGNTQTVARITLIKDALQIFTLHVKHTHTFFVGMHSALTHNICIPLAFNLGLSVAFGAGTGGTLGSFFGPPTLLIGAAVGC